MEQRTLGRTGLKVGVLGFGCGDVGGLIVRGTPAERERAVSRALEAGTNYFDTAASYGNGESEKNLGVTLRALRVRPYIGTKVRVPPEDPDTAGAITRGVEASLQRLGMDAVDLVQLHNRIVGGPVREGGSRESGLTLRRVLDEALPALQALRQQGKTRFIGITANGETAALHEVIDVHAFQSAQVSYNMLNPSAGAALQASYPAQDYGRLLDRTDSAGIGTVGIHVLAGGALSGEATCHPIGSPRPSRSAPRACMTPTSSGRAASCRWSRRATPPAWQKPRSATSSPTRL